MERLVMKFDLESLSWEGVSHIDFIESDIVRLKKIGATHINIKSNEYEESVEVIAQVERLETNEEFKLRMEALNKIKEMSKERDYRLYLSLKKKFEG